MPKVLKKRRRKFKEANLTVQYITDEWDPVIDGRNLVESIASALAQHHKDRLMAGADPATGVPWPELKAESKQGRRAAKGERSPNRGVNSTEFIDSIQTNKRATRVRVAPRTDVVGARDQVKTINDEKYRRWLQQEAKSGREFFSIEGDAEAIIERILSEWMGKAFRIKK